MRVVRDLRLIPVVALAAAALFMLKVSAIIVEGGYTLISSRVALAQGLGAPRSEAAALLARAGIAHERRPQELRLDEWRTLYETTRA